MKAIGAQWRLRREATGFSQAEIAEIAGISGPALSYLERGINNPTHDTTLRVNHALELAEAWHREEVPAPPIAVPEPVERPLSEPVTVTPRTGTAPPPNPRIQSRGAQLARCSRGLRPRLHDNYRAERTLLAPDWAPMARRRDEVSR